MSKYVMSDIHGCYKEFKRMLTKIDFSDEDELFIIGDVFDRGPDVLKIIDYITGTKNIHMLKGNHELFFQDAIETNDFHLWMLNGGGVTLPQITERGEDYLKSLYQWVKGLPLYKVIDDKFLLVHAEFYYPKNYNELSLEEFLEIQDEDVMLWSRTNTKENNSYRDYITISGHTVVSFIEKGATGILRKNNCIYIDCGAVFGRKLSCLRLDDLEEFYVTGD